jgi:hypothetical protein
MPIAERNRRALGAAEYAALVERTREVVRATIPTGTIVAVVSRGDDALLALDGRTAWHFPRAASGAYAGHHPSDAHAAVAHLEEVRASGAAYLVVPDCSRWWLDHYEALAAHLHEHGTLLADDDACAVYALAPTVAATPQAGGAPVEPATAVRMRRFLDALLPAPCRVLVARHEWSGLELPERAVVPLPDGTHATLAAAERQPADDDAPAYLVVPLAGDPPPWVGELVAELARTRDPIARRDSLAAVFDLHATATPTQG